MSLQYRPFFVVARDRSKDRVRLGGLGSLGVGTMWFDVNEEYKTLEGFDTAPEEDSSEDYHGFVCPRCGTKMKSGEEIPPEVCDITHSKDQHNMFRALRREQ